MTNPVHISEIGPLWNGKCDIRQWATQVRLPFLVDHLSLKAAVLCGTLPAELRRNVYGLSAGDPLPASIDPNKNGIIISAPGTGKDMAIIPWLLNFFRKVYVLMPSVVQAIEVEASLDALYDEDFESVLGLIAIPSLLIGMYLWILPDYVAACFHDGEKWLDTEAFWSTRRDYTLFAQAECGKLFGGFVLLTQARIPYIPNARRFGKFFGLVLFGEHRGSYKVIAIRLHPEGIEALEKKGKEFSQVDKPNITFQQEDEGLPFKIR